MNEVWKAIPGFEGRYEASTTGCIRSLSRVNVCWNGHSYCNIPRKGRILNPSPLGKVPYYVVYLKKLDEESGRAYYISRLILETFVGPCPEGMEACHYPDPCTNNNRLDNLMWGTRKENMSHRKLHGIGIVTGKLHS